MWLRELVLVYVMVTAASAATVGPSELLEKDDVIEEVNNAQTTWTAGRNFHPSLTKSYLRNLLGVKRRPGGSQLPKYVPDENKDNLELPENFDLRTKYPNCTGLNTVRDQGPCGSCWAVAAAAAFTDRLCITSRGAWNGQLSAQNVLSCLREGDGCDGADPSDAWEYFVETGVVTGGDYQSKEGCQPYTLPSCEHHVSGPRKNCSTYGKAHAPKCQTKCYNKSYQTPFSRDLHKVTSPWVISDDVTSVMKEIYKNGPVVASFKVYEDLLSYKTGVYRHTRGAFDDGHAVKVIGWGVEAGTKFWLVANSWNSDWGDHGFFKIVRGVSDCDFESEITGATPIMN